jgi:hypothetical protein
MKIRQGFVSNSSSSSFCIIGVTGDIAKTLARKEHLSSLYDEEGEWDYGHGEYWCKSDSILKYYGDGEEVYYAGIDAEELLNSMTVPEIATEFTKVCKDALGINVNPEQVKLRYGEVGNG